jgi:membrane-associated phospholipid phosphatase
MGLYSTFSFLSATLFSQLLKRCFFDDVNRPFFVFSYYNKNPITYVDGVEQYIHNSFPSGHSTQAFSIFMSLAFLTKNPLLKVLFFCIALLTALSRVYLSQHWLTDITAGSMIGMFFSAALYYIFISKNKFEKLNKPLSAFRKA